MPPVHVIAVEVLDAAVRSSASSFSPKQLERWQRGKGDEAMWTSFRRYSRRALAILTFNVTLLVAGCAGRGADDTAILSAADSACPEADQQPVLRAVESRFGENIVREISSRAFYPSEAMNAGQQGRTVVCVRYQRNGSLDRALIRQSSGYPLLDGAALYAAGLYATAAPRPGEIDMNHAIHLQELPPPPPELFVGSDVVWIDIPVNFEITDAKPAATTAPDMDRTGCSNQKLAPIAAFDGTEEQRLQLSASIAETVRRFRRHLFFPPVARAIAVSGSATLRYVVYDRQLECGWLTRSSGSPLFDGVTLMTLGYTMLDQRQQADMMKFPTGFFQFEQQVNFELVP